MKKDEVEIVKVENKESYIEFNVHTFFSVN